MSVSIVQQAKNYSAYQVSPLTVTLPSKTTTGSYLAVVVEAQKTAYPYGYANVLTPAPIVTDDKGNIYTLVDKVVQLTQDYGVNNPDAAGFFPSIYVYVTSAAAIAGTQSIAIGAFYPDEYTSPLQVAPQSPPTLNGRPVFDGGLHAQVFEVAGMATGVDQHSNGFYPYGTANIGSGLITTANASALIIEAGVLLDSSSLISDTNSTQQFAGTLAGGSSHFVVQTRIVSSATANAGFGNSLKYTGGIVAVSLK